MAGEIAGGMAASLDSGGLFFAMQTKASWSFGADLGSGAFSDEAESLFFFFFFTYLVQFARLSCSVQYLYP